MTIPNDTYVLLFDPLMNPLGPVQLLDIELTRSEMLVGTIKLQLNREAYGLFKGDKRDYIVQVWRSVAGGPHRLEGETLWFSRTVIQTYQNQQIVCQVTCFDALDILTTRIVAYAANTSQSSKTGAADDLIKAVVNENFISPATSYQDTTRALSSLASYLAVQNSIGAAPSTSKAFANQIVLSVLQDLAKDSFTKGTYLTFDVVWASSILELRTYIGQRGTDHGQSSQQPIVLDPQAGNISNASLTEDYSTVASVVYCGGQGLDTDRLVTTSIDQTRINVSPFGRVEKWVDARQSSTQAAVQAEGDAQLRGLALRRTAVADIDDVGSYLFGRDYGFGDKVVAHIFGLYLDCRVTGYNLKNDKVTLKVQSDS